MKKIIFLILFVNSVIFCQDLVQYIIPNADSLSGAVNLKGDTPVLILIPSSFDGDSIYFQIGFPELGKAYKDIKNTDGDKILAFPAEPGDCIEFTPMQSYGYEYWTKLRSDVTATGADTFYVRTKNFSTLQRIQ